MKSLITVAVLLLTTNVFAGRIDEDSTWKEIMKSRGHEAVFKSVSFVGTARSRSVYDVCHYEDNGVEMLSGGEAQKCAEWSRGRNERCMRYVTIQLRTPRDYTKKECTKWTHGRNERCVEWETNSYSYPLNHDVSVYTLRGRDDERSTWPAFKKSFTIPSCL